MQKLVRCKVCGYVMPELKLGEVCPACGAKRVVFEAYAPNISANRYKKLHMDFHPVLVHFPQAFPVCILAFLALSLVPDVAIASSFFITAKILALFLPLAAVAAIGTGVIDGKTRFKRITPLLKQKMVVGITYLALASVTAICFAVLGATDAWWPGVLLAAGCLSCSGFLGKVGAGLMSSFLPDSPAKTSPPEADAKE